MALHIRDDRAATLARRLAKRKGITMTDAVIEALEGALAREERPLRERIAEIANEIERWATAPAAAPSARKRSTNSGVTSDFPGYVGDRRNSGPGDGRLALAANLDGARNELRPACAPRSIDAAFDTFRAGADLCRCRGNTRATLRRRCDRADHRRGRPCRCRCVRALRQRPQKPGWSEFRRLSFLRLRQGAWCPPSVQRRRFRPHRYRQSLTAP